MKNIIYLVSFFSFSSIFFTSCTTQKIQYVDITVVLNDNNNSKENQPLNGSIKQLCNYFIDSNNNEIVYVPEITFERIDVNPIKSEKYKIELSQVYNIQKKLNTLPAKNLIKDYDEEVIPNLKTPALLAMPTGESISLNAIQSKYPDAEFIPMDDSLKIRIERYRSKIIKEVSDNSKNNFTVVLYKVNIAPKQLIEDTTQLTIDTTAVQTITTTVTEKEKVVIKETPIVKEKVVVIQNDCNKQVSASSVQDLFSQVASGKIPDCQKNSLMKSWSKYFTSDATVTYVHNDCSSNLAPMSIENFLYAIKGKNKTPYIQSDCNNKTVGGKYQSLSVQ